METTRLAVIGAGVMGRRGSYRMNSIIYLIRHAQSHPTYRLSHSEWPLSSIGKKQAAQVADLLMPLDLTKLYSSPYVRCMQTVEPFSARTGLRIAVKDNLRERLISRELINNFRDILGGLSFCLARLRDFRRGPASLYVYHSNDIKYRRR